MTPKGKERLLKLADILDVADAEHRAKKEPKYNQDAVAHPCGTPACALGHYAANNRSRLIWNPNSIGSTIALKRDQSLVFYGIGQAEFDITNDQALELFDSGGCGSADTGKQAARYIRRFVKRVEREQEQALAALRKRLEAGEIGVDEVAYA